MRGACLAGILAVVLLPLALALLAQPPMAPASGGPELGCAAQDLSTAALDRVQRLLGGELAVRLDAPSCTLALAASPGTPRAADPQPALLAPAEARAGACERTL
ncbi:MAG: hypothetical protein ACKOCB_06310 [Planctomycetia bacterium]